MITLPSQKLNLLVQCTKKFGAGVPVLATPFLCRGVLQAIPTAGKCQYLQHPDVLQGWVEDVLPQDGEQAPHLQEDGVQLASVCEHGREYRYAWHWQDSRGFTRGVETLLTTSLYVSFWCSFEKLNKIWLSSHKLCLFQQPAPNFFIHCILHTFRQGH